MTPALPHSTFRVLTGPQPAGIAVISIRGPALTAFLNAYLHPTPRPSTSLSHHRLLDPSGTTIDDPVLSQFSPTHAELSLHAGPEIVRQTVELLRSSGFTPEPEPTDLAARINRLLPLCRTELATRTLLAQLTHQHLPLTDSPALIHLLHPPTLAITGAPNVGKSTLLNRLAGTNAAITADLPGTTRDYVSIDVDLNGLVVRLLDTPGIRPTSDPIEAAAIANAHPAIRLANLQLLVLDASTGISPHEQQLLHDFPSALVVWNKSDKSPPRSGNTISATTGQGINSLISAILTHFQITPTLPDLHLPLP